MRLVAGVFSIAKPYFNLDPGGRFRQLGEVTHRGVEASLSGPVTDTLTLVAGTVLLDPVVAADVAGVGRRPVGAIRQTVTASADWRPAALPGVSFDANLTQLGGQTATVSNGVAIPPRTYLDIGGRYRFKLGGKAAMLRLQIENLLDIQGFELFGASAYRPIFGRAGQAYLTVDL